MSWAQIAAAVDAVTVVSDDSYTWLGEPVGLAVRVPPFVRTDGRRRSLIQHISHRLYNDCYTVGSPRPSHGPNAGRVARPGRLMEALSAANRGRGSYDGCWTYAGREDGQVIVERNGLRLWVDPADVRVAPVIDEVPIGCEVAVRWSREARAISPGFYMALSDTGLASPRPQDLDRFYFNVAPPHATDFMRHVTRTLNRVALAFRLKIADDPDRFDRHDSAVLTVQRRDRDVAHPAAVDIGRRMRACLRDGTPAFTLPLGTGFAYAEDPGNAKSFGAHRCDLIAEGIADAHATGCTDLAGRMDFVRARFEDTGLSIDMPYLDAPNVAGGRP